MGRLRARPARIAPVALVCAMVVAAGAVHAPRDAYAQTADELATARTLFAEALRDQDAKHHDVALEKFRRVQAVRDTAPIRYRIGMCHEALGRLAQAQANYQAAADMAAAEHAQDDIARAARSRMDALAKRVPRLSLAVTGRPISEVDVRVDDRSIPAAQLKEPLLVDPGEHVITASASGSKPFRTVVFLPESGAVALTVPLDAASFPGDPAIVGVTPPMTAATPPPPPAADAPSGQRTLAVVAMVGGGAVAVAGVVVLALRASAISDIEAACPGGVCPIARRSEIESSRDRALLFGPLGVGLGAGGVVVAGAGVVLLLTAPSSGASAFVTPVATPSFAGAVLGGRF